MKKIIIFLLTLMLIFPVSSSINLEVKKQSLNEVLIPSINEPVTFELKIKNLGSADNFEFYNLLGFKMFPVGTFFIGTGQTENVLLQISPIGDFNYRGYYTFTYFIKSQNFSEAKQELTFQVIDLKDAFEIGAGNFDSESNSIDVYVQNRINFNFEKVNAKFESVFFDFEETFSLDSNERKNFTVQLDKNDFKKLMAGFYTMESEIGVKGEKAQIEGVIRFSEKDIVKVSEKDYGFFINTKIIEKINEGNVLAKSETVIKKNIVSRLFTSFNPEPDIVEREGSIVYYRWIGEIKPGESLEVVVKTNWLFPLVIVLLIVITILFIKNYSGTDLVLRKRVSFVKAKGGEFALKVSMIINAKKYIEKVSIIDRLPALVKVHERFGVEKPRRINEKSKIMEWGFEKLEAGEIRTITYIIYSKVGIVGKFALPAATGIYEKDGEIKETTSNRAFFVSEQKVDKEEEDPNLYS
jgi:hypothetical protein